MQSTPPPPLKIFISYSHQDVDMKNELVKRLLSPTGQFNILSDDLLQVGDNWSLVLTRMREEAEVFLLLVSASYLSSKTVSDELQHVMTKIGSATIVPVILKRCNWLESPLGQFQAAPRFGRPVSEYKDREEAFAEIINALLNIANLRRNSRAAQIIKTEMETHTGRLVLSNCNLESIPRDILEMHWLKTLEIQGNDIKKIENLDNLVALTHLLLSDNNIEQIDHLDALKNLVLLDLRKNLISKIENLGHNTGLEMLGLSSNRINNLSGISHLQNLKTLYIGHNQLENIDELSHMPGLRRIVLTNNKIKSIKPLLEHIRRGLDVLLEYSYDPDKEGIFVGDNKVLSAPPIEVIEHGRDAILKYFDDAKIYGTRKLEIIKLILVGNSKVGKTNFSEFLRKLPLTAKHNSTHVLDIQRWDPLEPAMDDDIPSRVNIFDFGGQDYYHDSHRMYYSHDTAYILLWDISTNVYSEVAEPGSDPGDALFYENFPLEYWLESINYNLADRYKYTYPPEGGRGSKSNNIRNSAPVLILQNKIDINEGLLDQKVLYQQYPNISGFFNVSLIPGMRTQILSDVIIRYMKALNPAGRQVLEYENAIINDYLMHPRQFQMLSLDQFWKECRGIINDPNIGFNKNNASIVAEILNATGMVFYDKGTGGEGVIFTHIEQLNEIIKEVMDIAKKGNEKGIFSTDQIGHILYKEEILRLLRNNNSIIAINDSEYLVPQFLPPQPDPFIEFFLVAFTFCQVRFIYKAYFHKSVLLSLFSKYLSGKGSGSNTKVKNLPYWRNGIIISRGEGSSKEMVLVQFQKTEQMGIITIKTMKPYNKRGLEREVENMLDELNKGWTVSKEISVNSVDFFEVIYLKEEVKNLRYEFACNGKMFSVNDFKHITDFERLPKKLFISYSSRNSEFIRRFVTHLEVLKSSGLIDPWYDRMIESGTKWDDSIRKEMINSDVIIFLLSPDFLATEYIIKTEIPLAIQQMTADVAKFFFIELQSCGWKRTEIAQYQQTDDSGVTKKNVICIGQPDNDNNWNLVIDELASKLKV